MPSPLTVSLVENGEALATPTSKMTVDNENNDDDENTKEPLVSSNEKEESAMEKGETSGQKSEVREEDQMAELPMIENIFSLLYTARTCSSAFWISLFITVAQIAMPLLALVDLIVFTDTANPLQVPNNVSPQVRIMGAVGLILAVVQFWDFMEAVRKLQKGPPADLSNLPPGVALWKFYFAFTLQLLMGLLFLITIFILVVQSTNVVSMFLNFAALEFIVNVDDVAFVLAQKGYMTRNMKNACDDVSATKIKWRKGGGCMRRVLMLLTMSVLLGCYIYIRILELDGRFDCHSIDVQFGDGFVTILPVFSGLYAYKRDYYDGRPIYIDERERTVFRYCRDNAESEILSVSAGGYWAFGIIDKYDREAVETVCDSYISRSPNTKGYSLLEHPGNSWLVKRNPTDSMSYAVDYMSLHCADCSANTCNGVCEKGKCTCLQGEFGQSCQFDSQPCDLAHYDLRTSPFVGAEFDHSSRYEILRNSKASAVTLYDKPIYAHFWADGYADLLINMGRRYVLLIVEFSQSPGSDSSVNMTSFADYLEGFHPFYDWLEPQYLNGTTTDNKNDDEAFEPLSFESAKFVLPEFISDPIDSGTASDVNSPMGLSWTRAAASTRTFQRNPGLIIFDLLKLGAPVDTTLLCGKCSEDNECFSGGFCAPDDGSCSCKFGDVGMLCEASCYDNPSNPFCRLCFVTPEEPTCEECYQRSNADDCPLCLTDPLAEDCAEPCLSNETAPGCPLAPLASNFSQPQTNNNSSGF